MPQNKKPTYKQLLEWEYDPYRTLKPQVKRLLNEIAASYDRLVQNGTSLDYRLALASHAADAKGILMVARESESVLHRRDIL